VKKVCEKEFDWLVVCWLWENIKTMLFDNMLGKVCTKERARHACGLAGRGIWGSLDIMQVDLPDGKWV